MLCKFGGTMIVRRFHNNNSHIVPPVFGARCTPTKSTPINGCRRRAASSSSNATGSLSFLAAIAGNLISGLGRSSAFTNQNVVHLCYHPASFYSQKVLMALFEKSIPFKYHYVDLLLDQQYKDKFIAVNPRGEVPVLIMGTEIVADSVKIIDFLEKHFTDAKALIPVEHHDEIVHFRNLLATVPVDYITLGAGLHQRFVKNAELQFSPIIQSALVRNAKSIGSRLRSLALSGRLLNDEIILKKADAKDMAFVKMREESLFKETLNVVEQVLDKIEDQLSKNAESNKVDSWLCSDTFTVADIDLIVLLERLHQIGLAHMFWSAKLRPNIALYYKRAQERESYKRGMPSRNEYIRMYIKTYRIPITILAIALIIIVDKLLSIMDDDDEEI